MKTEAKILLGTTLIGVALLAGLIFMNKNLTSPTKVDGATLVREDSHATSGAPLKVTLVEFGDYECPACGAAHPVVEKLREDYKGRFNFVFRHFPLPQHKGAIPAALVAEAAAEQGKFWEMHDKLYKNQDAWVTSSNPNEIFKGYANELGLNMEQFNQALESKKYNDKVNRDRQDGISLGVNSTPTFFINNQQFKGALNYAEFVKIIETELNK